MLPVAQRSRRTRISASELRNLQPAVDETLKKWDGCKRQVVTESEWQEAKRSVEMCQNAWAKANAELAAVQRRVRLLRIPASTHRLWTFLADKMGLEDGHWWVSGLLAAIPTFLLVALWVVVAKPDLVTCGLLLGIGLLGSSLLAWATLNPASRKWVEQRIGPSESRLAYLQDVTKEARHRLDLWRKQQRDLRYIHEAAEGYRIACERLQRAQQTLADERYQLIHMDWKALRGIPFEQFLARVFTVLGYQVEDTKASGDQGVDLIVWGKGTRYAIQAKGYEGSVGNSAVQEIYAGMTHYGCDQCVVITNSRFTRAACNLALSVNCMLIDEGRMLDLIEGKVL